MRGAAEVFLGAASLRAHSILKPRLHLPCKSAHAQIEGAFPKARFWDAQFIIFETNSTSNMVYSLTVACAVAVQEGMTR